MPLLKSSRSILFVSLQMTIQNNNISFFDIKRYRNGSFVGNLITNTQRHFIYSNVLNELGVFLSDYDDGGISCHGHHLYYHELLTFFISQIMNAFEISARFWSKEFCKCSSLILHAKVLGKLL